MPPRCSLRQTGLGCGVAQRGRRIAGLQVVAGDLLAARAAGVHEIGFLAAGVHPGRDARGRGPPVAPLGDAEEDRPQLAAGLGQVVAEARGPLLSRLGSAVRGFTGVVQARKHGAV